MDGRFAKLSRPRRADNPPPLPDSFLLGKHFGGESFQGLKSDYPPQSHADLHDEDYPPQSHYFAKLTTWTVASRAVKW